jgi:ABC transporter substrate binding protein
LPQIPPTAPSSFADPVEALAAEWAHRRHDVDGRGKHGCTSAPRGIHAGLAGIRLGCGPQRADRDPLAGGRCRAHTQRGSRIGRARAGRHPTGSATVAPLLQATRTVPIVFVIVPDPVGAGFVDSLARPGGNVLGLWTAIRAIIRVTSATADRLKSLRYLPD